MTKKSSGLPNVRSNDWLAFLDVPFLFWVCPVGCDDFVDWKDNVATCRKCGRRSDDEC